MSTKQNFTLSGPLFGKPSPKMAATKSPVGRLLAENPTWVSMTAEQRVAAMEAGRRASRGKTLDEQYDELEEEVGGKEKADAIIAQHPGSRTVERGIDILITHLTLKHAETVGPSGIKKELAASDKTARDIDRHGRDTCNKCGNRQKALTLACPVCADPGPSAAAPAPAKTGREGLHGLELAKAAMRDKHADAAFAGKVILAARAESEGGKPLTGLALAITANRAKHAAKK